MIPVYTLDEIRQAVAKVDTIRIMEEGFEAYTSGRAVVPPVGELLFEDPPGDVHIKYGYLKGGATYVIKIASGFYDNPKRGLPSSSGMMLLFQQDTGQPVCILMDEGYLTDVRTAAAGALAATYLAPKRVHRIGIFGAGTQGRMQLLHLSSIIDCRDVLVWGLHEAELEAYRTDMKQHGFTVHTTQDAEDVASTCNLIVTATPSKEPLLHAGQIRKGTHITAVGSDTQDKQELDPAILAQADIIVADSLSQCRTRGEIHHALKRGMIREKNIYEMGELAVDKRIRRVKDDQITVADLTGVAVQDIQIAASVFNMLTEETDLRNKS